jgi:branched-chain amino acid transport system permease protein
MQARAVFDLPGALKDAGKVAGIVVLLALALVGARTQDFSGGPPLAFRFDDVLAVAVLAFAGRLGLLLLRAHRPVPVLVVALAFAAALTGVLAVGLDEHWLPFQSAVFNWVIALAAWGLGARAAWLVWHAASDTSPEVREARMDRLGARVQKSAMWLGPLLLGFAVVLPFLP